MPFAAHRRTWTLPVLLLTAAMVLLTACRLATWLLNPGDFTGLTIPDAAVAFLRGLRFDICISLIVLAGPALMLALPVPWAASRPWRAAWLLAGILGLTVLAVVAIADTIYFGWVHRHLGQEVRSFFHDPTIAGALLAEHWMPLAGICLALLAAVVMVLATVRRSATGAAGVAAWALWVVAVGLTVLGIRGSVASKPLQVVNAFAGGSLAQGMLTLNGPFALAKTLDKGVSAPPRLMPEGEAAAATAAFLGSDPACPLARARGAAATTEPPPNVVVLLLESWGALHVDVCRRSMGLPPEGRTPGFDRLATQGLMFGRFYANGQRSMEGMAALLAGMPTVPGFPFIGEGLEQSRMRYLGGIARDHGYRTLFMQGSRRSSYRMDAVARLAGFDEYLGAEDIPYEDPARPPTHDSLLGAHDGDLLAELVRRTAHLPEPYLAVAFTLSTHGPVSLPEDRWRTTPDSVTHAPYLDAMRYSDWAVTRCADALLARGGRRTIVVVLADHTAGLDPGLADPVPLHRIPLLILGTADVPRSIGTVGSQVDVIPTLMGLCGWDGLFTGPGKDLLSADPERAAMCVRGDLTSLIGPAGWVVHHGATRLSADGQPDAVEALSARLRALQQTVGDGLSRNRILPYAGTAAAAPRSP